MPESQIKIEVASFKRLFPIFAKFSAKRLGMGKIKIKKYKNFYLVHTSSSKQEIYHFIENLYNFSNFFNIQKIVYDFK